MTLHRVPIAREKEYADTGIRCADDALRYHADLFSIAAVGKGGGVMQRFDASLRSAAIGVTERNKLTAEKAAQLKWLIGGEIEMLEKGQTIFVCSEIVDEINEASLTMLDTVLIEQDLFTPRGLLVLEKPFIYAHTLESVDRHTTEGWMVKAIGYSMTVENGQPGINVFLYGNIDYVHHNENDTTFLVYPEKIQVLSDIIDIPRLQEITKEEMGDNSMQFFRDMAYGHGRFIDYSRFNFGPQETQYDESILKLKKFLLSYFRLSFEYLEQTRTLAGRPARRTLSRLAMPHDGYIVEMKLRRTQHGDKLGGTHASPAYAFRVRGHWKRAYLPSRRRPVGDPAAYKHIYVKDYIKGRGDVVESKRVLRVEK